MDLINSIASLLNKSIDSFTEYMRENAYAICALIVVVYCIKYYGRYLQHLKNGKTGGNEFGRFFL